MRCLNECVVRVLYCRRHLAYLYFYGCRYSCQHRQGLQSTLLPATPGFSYFYGYGCLLEASIFNINEPSGSTAFFFILPLFSIFYLVLALLASPSSSSSSFGGSARVFLHWELAERAVLGFKFFASSRECSGVMNALFSVVVFCFYASCGVAVG